MHLPKLKADLRRIRELVTQLNPLMDSIIANSDPTFDPDCLEARQTMMRGFDYLNESTSDMQAWAERQIESDE